MHTVYLIADWVIPAWQFVWHLLLLRSLLTPDKSISSIFTPIRHCSAVETQTRSLLKSLTEIGFSLHHSLHLFLCLSHAVCRNRWSLLNRCATVGHNAILIQYLYKNLSMHLSLSGQEAVCSPLPRDLQESVNLLHESTSQAGRFLRARGPESPEKKTGRGGVWGGQEDWHHR